MGRYGRSTTQQERNLVPFDSVEGIAYDGHKLKRIMKDLRTGVPQKKIVGMVGQKSYDRALALKDKIDNKMATLLPRLPLDMGLIHFCQIDGWGWGFTLTPKGNIELTNVAKWGGPHYTANVKKAFLKNEAFLVRKYKTQLAPDEGSAILKAWLTGLTLSKELALNNVIATLASKLHMEEVDEDLEEQQKKADNFFPLKDPHTDAMIGAFQDIQDAIIETKTLEDEEAQEEDEFTLEIPANEEGDEEVGDNLNALIGPHSISGDPIDKRRAFIWDLNQMKSEADNFSAEEIWEGHIRPIVEHYTSNTLLGRSQEYVHLPIPDGEAIKEREDFPYEPNTDRAMETYFKSDKVTYVDVPGQSKRQQVRVIIEKRREEEFLQEPDADFGLRGIWMKKEDIVAWRGKIVYSALCNPIGKAELDRKGRETYLLNRWKLVAKARYLKTLGPNEMPTKEGEAKMLKRCLYYY